MILTESIFNVKRLFSISELKTTKKAEEICNFPFDLKFTKTTKTKLGGSGVYAMVHDGIVIYIGKFMPYGSGDVINDRWLKHLATISSRGYNVGFGNNSSSIVRFESIYKKQNLDSFFSNDENNWRYRDTGTVTSINRAAYAMKHWEEFKSLGVNDNSALDKIDFHFYKIKNSTEDEARSNVTLLETALINQFHPICNNNSQNAETSSPKVKDIKKYIQNFRITNGDLTEENVILKKGGME